MATWAFSSGLKGYYTSPNLSVNLDGDGVSSQINWDADVPNGTNMYVETNVSLDGGYTWEGWKRCSDNASIPDLDTSTYTSTLVLKYRVVMETTNALTTPILKSMVITLIPVIEFVNDGDIDLYPEVYITKNGQGDVTITNLSNNNDKFEFKDLINGETVYVNNETQHIETDLAMVYRYANFNDNYMKLPRGANVLQVQGNCKLRFKYQSRTLQG
jgi:hypothetical protein